MTMSDAGESAPSRPYLDPKPVVFVGIVGGLVLGSALVSLPPAWVMAGVAALAATALAARRPMWALQLVLLMLPLEFVEFSAGPVASLSAVQIGGLLLLGLTLASAMTRGGFPMPRTPLDVAIFLWLAVGFLGAVEALDPAAAVKKAGMTLVFAGIYYVAVANAHDANQASRLSKCLVLAASGVGTYALWVSYRYLSAGAVTKEAVVIGSEGLKSPRAASTLANPNVLATLMVLVIPIALACFVTNDRWQKLAWSTAIAILVLALGFTFSRGAWLGAAASAVVLATDRRFRAILLVGAVALILLAPPVVMERAATSAELGRGEIAARFDFWQGALLLVQQRPLVGIGTSNFAPSFARLPVPETAAREAAHAHNVFLTVLAENGVFGFLAYCMLVGGALTVAVKNLRHRGSQDTSAYQIAIAASLVGYLFHGLTDSFLSDPAINTVLWLLMALAVAFADQVGHIKQPMRTGPESASA